ncbi:DNA internalization-related competence protein ComEC/Rec2 [Ideonella sp. BN130291]|uniref:DNA internalization-related competence protein ComEC/Rec2 n=1 Tax=Ideonella sp. BN130291 TaxID=3112940 RepID=UPI002E254FEA|nr:DNA internalization-related competence protein ComEC/Rec2 [Ideonella sp. BN130291]
MGAGGVHGHDRPASRLTYAGTALAGVLLAWLGGLVLQLQQPALWSAALYGGIASAAFILVGLAWRARSHGWPALLAAMLAVGAVGFSWAGWRAGLRLADGLPTALEGQNLMVTGVVASLPQVSASGSRFLFRVDSAQWRGQPVQLPPLLALGWYRNWQDDTPLDDPRAELRAGQRWQLPVRLKRPHGAMNPGGFDQELWLFEQGVRANGYVRATPATPARQLEEAAGFALQRLRQSVRDAIFERVPDPRAAGVLAALSVGDQGAIEREDWELFRASGIAHLVSISGLHVTMFAWLAGTLIGVAWRRSARLMLRCPAPWAARWGGVAAAAGYALLSGWGVPSQRTVWMLLTAAALCSMGTRWPWLLVLLATAAVVTVIDPWALLQVGFWLSFVAVALLMSSAPGAAPSPSAPAGRWHPAIAGAARALREGVRTQAIATLGLAPLTLVFFQQLSLVGFVANLVAIPLVTLVITPLALLGLLLPPLWQLDAWVVQALAGLLGWLVALPGAVWTVPQAPAWAQAAGLLAGALLLLPLPWRWRLLAMPLALPLLWPAVPQPPHGRYELLAADVGQGTAVLLRTRSHQLLYDTGPQYSPESNAGDRVLLPLLRLRGTEPLDLLMLSHSDTDHVGGAASLLAHWPVSALSSSLPPGHALLAKGVQHTPCQAGQQWQWDGVRFTVLHPSAQALQPPPPGTKPPKPNALSCVLRVEDAAGHSVLLTGDAEAAQEALMLAAGGNASLHSELMLVPHHGSRTSSTPAFLDAVAPRLAIVQAGYRSRFGHPAPDVMARYAERGIAVVRSDRCGAFLWSADESACQRDLARRYWHFTE